MQRLTYALRFRGEVTRIGIDGNVLRIVSRTPGGAGGERIVAEACSEAAHRIVGEEATLESEWVFTGATTFQETGRLVLGQESDRLVFSTFGSAYLGPVADDDYRHGATVRWIEGGDGRFAATTGLIASVFSIGEDLSFVERHAGVLLVP
jgi:hypothetical protein